MLQFESEHVPVESQCFCLVVNEDTGYHDLHGYLLHIERSILPIKKGGASCRQDLVAGGHPPLEHVGSSAGEFNARSLGIVSVACSRGTSAEDRLTRRSENSLQT